MSKWEKEEYELPIPRGTAHSIVGGHDWGLYAIRLGGLGVLITDSHPTKQWSHNNVTILEKTNPLNTYICSKEIYHTQSCNMFFV